jgi:septal ring factor EnvC (AmiA/AmiB activator)
MINSGACPRCGTARTAYEKAIEFHCGSYVKADGGFIQSNACKLEIQKAAEKRVDELQAEVERLEAKVKRFDGYARGHLAALNEAVEDIEQLRLRLERYENPDVEKLSESVHDAWWQESKRQGREGEQSMVPYSELPDSVKEYDRVTVRAVLDALKA